MHHLNRPTESFFQQSNGIDNRIPVRSIAFLDAMFKLNDMVVHLLINIYQSTKSSLVLAFLKGLDNSSHLS
ncbi:MAG: hypothetical protein RL000_1305 [Bacteroidota bacterium]